MHNYLRDRNERRVKRALRVRKKLRGTTDVPRLTVKKSNKAIYVQVIDDSIGKTLASANSFKLSSDNLINKKSKQFAQEVGKKIAQDVLNQNVKEMIFDRGHYKYHGVIATLVDAVREAGVKI